MGTKIVCEEFFELLVQKIRVRVSLSESFVREILTRKLTEYGFTLQKTDPTNEISSEQISKIEEIIERELAKAGI